MRGLMIFLMALAAVAPAAAQSPFGRVAGDAGQVSVSGISSGAAMAVQYALAHSHSVTALGSVAGPGYRCARGDLGRAFATCMIGSPHAADMWEELGKARDVDDLAAPARRLRAAYVFHSASDATVLAASGKATAELLRTHVGLPLYYDDGEATDGSSRAAHGFISPDGTAPCGSGGTSFVRACGGKDLAGDMFHYFFGDGAKPPRPAVQTGSTRSFPQDPFIAQVRAATGFTPPNPRDHPRRADYDFATTGWLYVPPACDAPGARCAVHVAFHGCRMAAEDITRPPALVTEAGYNRWADLYRVIVLYPQLQHNGYQPTPKQHANDNSCWDWWGYLNDDYANAKGPQMRVISAMVAELTRQKP